MKEIIKTVIEKLQEIPDLRYIAEDWGQLDFDDRTVKFPCALVDINGFEFKQMGRQAQSAEGDIYIRIADDAANISSKAPDKMQERAGNYYDLLEKVHNAIHGLTDNQTFQKLMQTSIKRIRRDTGIREYILVFNTSYMVESNLPKQVSVSANINIK